MNPFLTCSPLPHPLHRSAIRSPHRQSHCRPIWAIYAVLKPSPIVVLPPGSEARLPGGPFRPTTVVASRAGLDYRSATLTTSPTSDGRWRRPKRSLYVAQNEYGGEPVALGRLRSLLGIRVVWRKGNAQGCRPLETRTPARGRSVERSSPFNSDSAALRRARRRPAWVAGDSGSRDGSLGTAGTSRRGRGRAAPRRGAPAPGPRAGRPGQTPPEPPSVSRRCC